MDYKLLLITGPGVLSVSKIILSSISIVFQYIAKLEVVLLIVVVDCNSCLFKTFNSFITCFYVQYNLSSVLENVVTTFRKKLHVFLDTGSRPSGRMEEPQKLHWHNFST